MELLKIIGQILSSMGGRTTLYANQNKDIKGRDQSKDVHGNYTNTNVHGNRTDTDVHGNPMKTK